MRNTRSLDRLNVRIWAAGYSYGDLGRSKGIKRSAHDRLYYFRSGTGTVEIDNVPLIFEREQILLIPAKTQVSLGRGLTTETYTAYWTQFDACLGNASLFDVIPVPRLISVQDPANVCACFERILSAEENKENSTSVLRQKAAILELIAFLMEQRDEEKSVTTPSVLQTSLDYIEHHLQEHLTIEELSQIEGLSTDQYTKAFRTETGVSPGRYIRQKRLDLAKISLLKEDQSIKEIASQIGYQDESYFTRSFKKYVGKTPREYRKETLSTRRLIP